MTSERSTAIARGARAARRGAAAAALLFACATQAQDAGSINDYQLPPQPAPAPAPVEGPVDSERPVINPTPRPSPAPTTAPSAAPTPRILLPEVSLPVERSPGEAAASRTRRSQTGQPQLAAPPPAAPPATGDPASADMPPPDVAAPVAPEPAGVAAAPETPAAVPNKTSTPWIALVAGLVALLAGAAWLWRRRKPARIEPAAREADAVPAISPSAPATLPPVSQVPAARPVAPPVPAPVPAPAPAAAAAKVAPTIDGPVEVRLEPRSLRFSVVYATFLYRLELTNHGDETLGPLQVAGDLASAHASIPVWQQLSTAGAVLETKHDIATLAPGETATLSGELRLPLAEVVAIRAGAAQLFAPLVRFLVDGLGVPPDPHVFSIGQPSDRPGGQMQPFRLDLGPQFFPEVHQRPVDVARWLPADPARKAG